MADTATLDAPAPAAAPVSAPAPAAAPSPDAAILKPVSPSMQKGLKAFNDKFVTPPAAPEPAPVKKSAENDNADANDTHKAPDAPATKDAPKTTTTDDAPDPKVEQSKMPPEMEKAVRGKDGKVQPWKLANWYKDRFGDAQAEIARLKTTSLAESEKAEYLTRVEKAEARIKEFEDETRLTNYSKSQEFQDKYQKPYDGAWKRTMNELNGLTVPTEDGNGRPFTAQDMLSLVNMDSIPARKAAQELYGDFANDVMLHRNEIRRMADEQAVAIEEAKTNGAKREKERTEIQTKTQREITENIRTTFKSSYESAQKDEVNGRFFSPKEGDEEWNTALENGRKLSASVFMDDPKDPKLTPQERAEIVKKHAAVFNRSSAFGPLKRAFIKLEKQYAELEKKLAGYQSSRPDAAGGSQQAANGVAAGKFMDRTLAELGKLAK
jgi:hypothetical protein